MKIHVTGATGFVGAHFVAGAKRDGHEVVALVRSKSAELSGVTQIEIGDMAERTDWSAAVAGADCVVHLAARVHVMHESGTGLDELYEKYNTAPTLALAKAAADAGVGRFVFVSSIKVNGEKTTGEPFTAASPAAPVDAYGRSKHVAEQRLAELAASSGLAVSIARPTVVYGAGVGGNIQRIASAVQKRVPLPLGSANNQRSLLGVTNLVGGLLSAAASERPGVSTYLLADPEPVTTRRLIELLGEGMGVSPRLFRVPTGLIRFGAKLVGRSTDADRLFDDLVVVPDWDALGVLPGGIQSSEAGLVALGRKLQKTEPTG